ncbi:hypothetical protein PENARI_c023G10887 [Penicillium arizonense]|uniref:Uncharacterized protein n=1 Tax=Penicillium arizonense TaxID=1835702 RepID=A0A1F5L826_PENAI|nr:hypothetical protein PENARI_c023G10887 [Penicillium arizonense]OGE49206.1 hypothetical protein PENARI_c023G10887 [Penicillium arizonense]
MASFQANRRTPKADPVKDNFTAPYLYTTISASELETVRVAITAGWKTLYDQGGSKLASSMLMAILILMCGHGSPV